MFFLHEITSAAFRERLQIPAGFVADAGIVLCFLYRVDGGDVEEVDGDDPAAEEVSGVAGDCCPVEAEAEHFDEALEDVFEGIATCFVLVGPHFEAGFGEHSVEDRGREEEEVFGDDVEVPELSAEAGAEAVDVAGGKEECAAGFEKGVGVAQRAERVWHVFDDIPEGDYVEEARLEHGGCEKALRYTQVPATGFACGEGGYLDAPAIPSLGKDFEEEAGTTPDVEEVCGRGDPLDHFDAAAEVVFQVCFAGEVVGVAVLAVLAREEGVRVEFLEGFLRGLEVEPDQAAVGATEDEMAFFADVRPVVEAAAENTGFGRRGGIFAHVSGGTVHGRGIVPIVGAHYNGVKKREYGRQRRPGRLSRKRTDEEDDDGQGNAQDRNGFMPEKNGFVCRV